MPRILTPFTEMMNIDYPIVGAPMFLVSYPDLVVATSEAGGIGTFPSPNYRTHEAFEDAIKEIKSRTDKPFGVNLPLKLNDRLPADVETILREEVAMVITSLGDPSSIIAAAKGTKTRVFSDVINKRHAAKVVQAGVDGLIAVAYGAGGHAGRISPFVLGPWLKAEFGLPVLCAGGISDGTGIAAALSLGMDGVYVGTRFIATQESPVDDDYKQAIITSEPEDIEYTDKISGIMGNYIRSSIPDGVNSPDQAQKGRYKSIWSAGQGVGMIDDIPTCKELIDRMVREYEKTRTQLPPLSV